MIKHSITHTPQGLPVVRLPMQGVDSVTVLVLVNTGSRYENTTQEGIAHFFEHMVFKGTEKYPNAESLARTVDSIGANFNAFTSKEYTGYYVKAAADHLSLAIDVVSDMLLAPKLRQEDIDREKGVIIEELNMYADSPPNHIANLFDQMMFRGSGLGHDIIGRKETILSFSSQDFGDFLHDWYGHKNMVLVLAGKSQVVEAESTLEMASQAFSKTGEKRQNTRIDLKKYLQQDPFSGEKLHLESRETQQAHLVLGWPGIKRTDEDRFALSLLSVIMGGNMSSRLFSEVREKRGLCYYINSGIDQFHDSGVLETSAGVDPSRVDEALKVAKEEYYSLLNGEKPVTAEELKRAQDYLIGKMILSFEDSEAVAQYYGLKQVLMGRIETPQEVIEKIRQTTPEKIMEVAQKVIQKGEMRLALIGPFKDKGRFEKSLG
jgi:predicted Zn-dependent peptidase